MMQTRFCHVLKRVECWKWKWKKSLFFLFFLFMVDIYITSLEFFLIFELHFSSSLRVSLSLSRTGFAGYWAASLCCLPPQYRNFILFCRRRNFTVWLYLFVSLFGIAFVSVSLWLFASICFPQERTPRRYFSWSPFIRKYRSGLHYPWWGWNR